MTIITIRGTSGSGKTTLARRIMEMYHQTPEKHFREGRKQPLMYTYPRIAPDDGPSLRVLGHYESATGGGDTISDGQDYIAELARQGHAEGHDVIYEGLVVSSDFSRIAKMHEDGLPVAVIVLRTPLEVCLASVKERRAAKGNHEPLNPKTTTEKHRAVLNMVPRFQAAGIRTYHLDRDAAFMVAREILGLGV